MKPNTPRLEYCFFRGPVCRANFISPASAERFIRKYGDGRTGPTLQIRARMPDGRRGGHSFCLGSMPSVQHFRACLQAHVTPEWIKFVLADACDNTNHRVRRIAAKEAALPAENQMSTAPSRPPVDPLRGRRPRVFAALEVGELARLGQATPEQTDKFRRTAKHYQHLRFVPPVRVTQEIGVVSYEKLPDWALPVVRHLFHTDQLPVAGFFLIP